VAESVKKVSSPKPIRILVLQMGRLSDTLQSLMALKAAYQLYPQLEIHFVVREKFSEPATRVKWLSSVRTLPTQTLLGPVVLGERTVRETLGEATKWIEPLVETPWDIVLNWSYSKSSSYLAGLIPARIKLGFTRKKDSALHAVDGWSHYIQGVVQERIPQNIHLTDILTTQLLTALQIHYQEPSNDGNSPVTSKSFFNLNLDERGLAWAWRDLSRKWIGIQLGASGETRAWSAQKWAELASEILRRHPTYGIVLLGDSRHKPLAREFMDHIDRSVASTKNVVTLVGETSFDLWAASIGRCHWLFCADSSAIHLASVLGTRVLNVCTGPVRWSETGPYGNSHVLVTPNHACEGCEHRSKNVADHSCQESIQPEAVYAAWSYAAADWSRPKEYSILEHFHQLGYESAIDSVQIYRSRIRASDDGGGVNYEPILHEKLTLDAWCAMVMGHIARAWYCGWTPTVAQGLRRTQISAPLLKVLRELKDATQVLGKICDESAKTCSQLHFKSKRLPSQKVMDLADQQAIQELGKKLTELESLIDRMAKASPPMRVFSVMSKILMHNLDGVQLSDLSSQSAHCYRQLKQGVMIFDEWIDQTISLVKPTVISSNPALSP